MASVVSVSAAVIYSSGLNRVENTEKYDYIYEGYIQVDLTQVSAGYRADRGYIRYTGGASRDTDRLYTPYSRGQTVSRSHTYRDTLNPIAPKTQFYYGFEWQSANIPYSLDVKN